MRRVAAGYLAFLNLLKALAGAVIFTVFLLIVSDVLIRLAGFKPWLYSSVLVEYGLLWFTMLSAPWLARNKRHVFIDAITQLMPGAAQRAMAKIVYLVCVAISSVAFYYSLRLLITAIAQHQIDIGLGGEHGERLHKAGINAQYAYATLAKGSKKADVVLGVSDLAGAIKATRRL